MPLPNSLYRKNIGFHTYFHDKKQKTQKQQDNYILRLSRRPGLHFDNIHRQNVAYSMLQLMSILSSAQVKNSSFTRNQKNDDEQFSYYHNNQKNFRNIKEYKDNKIQRMSIEIEHNSLNALRQPKHAATNIHNELMKKNRSKIQSSSPRNKRSIPITASKKISNRNADIHTEQFRKIFELLKKNGCETDLTKPINLLNKLIHYINVESKTRIKEIEMLLASAFGSSNKEEFILDGHEVTFMAMYLNYEILGMSLNDFFLDQIRFIKLYPQLLLNNDYLKIRFNSFLDFPSDKGQLSHEANRYYRESVLNKLLPTLALQLNAEDRIELKGIDITQPRWGFIHAGARILNDSGANLGDMRLTDIEDVGIILNLMLCEKSVPQTYAGYFRLPALIYYAKTKPNALSIPMINEYDMQKIFQHYFDYVEKWQKINSPIEQLNDLLNDWKTRPDLAKNKLRHYKISYDWLTNYLNSHGEMKLASKSEKRIFETNGFVHRIPNKIIQLPNIDKIFEDQNLKLADALLKVDELLLPQIFNSLSEDAQRFIEQSRVDRVRIQFNARDSISGVALAPSSQMGLVQSDAFVYHIPDHIDLLQCTLKGAKISYEHIYALTKSNATGSYMIKRVDRDRKALLDLLDDSGIPRYDEDYKIRVTSHLRLKEENDPPGKLIENLAEVHKKKLLIKLYNQGYDKTTQEKVKDFLLSLIPFYTCITEGVKGNEQEATLACIFDFANLIPFAGKAVYTGIRFSNILGKTAVRAVRYGARKTTVKMALKEIVVNMIQHSPLIAHEISPEVMRRLGTQFLNDINPSFGLLKYGGNKGINAIENILSKIKYKSYGITKLSDAFKKINYYLSTPFKSRNPKFDEAKQKDNFQSINEFSSSTIQLRVSNECKRLITEWSQLKSNLDEDLDKLYFLAENMKEAEPALADFIEAGNVGINEYQRYGTDTSSGKYEREAKELYHTYDRLKNYDGFSYRVIILPSERVSSFKVGDVILDKGFASSSALINNAKEWLHSGYIKQNIKMDHKFVLVIYDKNVDKKIAGNSFLIDHIMVRPGEKTLINNIDTLTEKGVSITVLGVSKYFGVADAADIYTNKT